MERIQSFGNIGIIENNNIFRLFSIRLFQPFTRGNYKVLSILSEDNVISNNIIVMGTCFLLWIIFFLDVFNTVSAILNNTLLIISDFNFYLTGYIDKYIIYYGGDIILLYIMFVGMLYRKAKKHPFGWENKSTDTNHSITNKDVLIGISLIVIYFSIIVIYFSIIVIYFSIRFFLMYM